MGPYRKEFDSRSDTWRIYEAYDENDQEGQGAEIAEVQTERMADVLIAGLSPVTGIRICKIEYQATPFVHGTRNGKDVWLTNKGEWSVADGDPNASIPLRPGLAIISLEGLHENELISELFRRGKIECKLVGTYTREEKLEMMKWCDRQEIVEALRRADKTPVGERHPADLPPRKDSGSQTAG